jgi:tetratricopeptide (TPR) repeat protein
VAWLTLNQGLPAPVQIEPVLSQQIAVSEATVQPKPSGRLAPQPNLADSAPIIRDASVRPASAVTSAAGEANRQTRESADALARTGWHLLGIGDYRGAAQAFSEAAGLVPDDPMFLVGLAFSRHRLSQDDMAISALQRAIQLDPNTHQAHKLLGDLYAQRHDLVTAIQHYEVAGRLDPNDVTIQTSLRAVRREWEEETGFDRLFTPHFVVKYHGVTGRTTAKLLAEPLEAVYHSVGQNLTYLPDEPFTVVLYPDRQFREITLSPSWAGGFFDGRILLSLERLPRNRTSLIAVLKHEYVHAVVHRLSGGQTPTWLDEGLALNLGGGDRSRDLGLLARHGEQVISLQALHDSFLDFPPRMAELAYAESYAATRMLVRRYGLRRVRQLLETLSVEPEFSRSFATVFGDRYGDFDAAWMAQLAGARS